MKGWTLAVLKFWSQWVKIEHKICSFYHSIYGTRNGTEQQIQFSYVFRIQISP